MLRQLFIAFILLYCRDNFVLYTNNGQNQNIGKVIRTTSKNIDIRKHLQGQDIINDDKLKASFKQNGIQGIVSAVNARLDDWQNEEVNIAVIGRTGVGKSTFINAVRGDLNENNPQYASVGHSECTYKRQPYPHPTNEKLIFWDLPGVGTINFPRNKYLKNEELKLSSYDAFVLMTSKRFTEDEIWLGTEFKKMGKMFIFVRSQVDTDIESDSKLKKKAGRVSDPQWVVQTIRDDCKKNLQNQLGDDFNDIYLINSLDLQYENLDFDKLLDRLVLGFTGIKAEVLLKTLTFLTPSLLKEKIRSLKKRIWGMGVLSSISGAVPVPGTSLIADALLIANETRLYRKSLGLSDDDLGAIANLMGMPVDVLAEKFSLKSLAMPLTTKAVLASSALLASELVEVAAGLALPVIGMPVGAVLSFATTVWFLLSILSIMESDANIALGLITFHAGVRVFVLSKSEYFGDSRTEVQPIASASK